jgi:hypothetical protein
MNLLIDYRGLYYAQLIGKTGYIYTQLLSSSRIPSIQLRLKWLQATSDRATYVRQKKFSPPASITITYY